MGAIRDALEKALADAAVKREGAALDDDRVQLLLKIKKDPKPPVIKYKPRVAKISPGTTDREPRKKVGKEQRRPATQAAPIDGAAIDRRIRSALLKKSRKTQHVPLASTLEVYGNRHGTPGSKPSSSSAAPSIARIDADTRVVLPPATLRTTLLDHAIEERGIVLEHIIGTAAAPRELVLGLDFGSSSTKLVISDRAAGKSFAVPVAGAVGTRRFLLPTAIHECDDRYSLDGNGTLHTGLKSDLLASPDNAGVRERAVAYLALVIRRARGWLFTTHESIYRDVPIFWTLSIGIPKQQGQIDRDTSLYKRLAAAAWRVAGAPAPVTTGNIVAAMQRNEGSQTDDTVEVRVVPEIAAEIYGFVSSESFDPKGYNDFLIVDVGGKTLDASLFHARPERANSWNFHFYTSVVQPLGAIELHFARIGWWQELMRERSQDDQVMRLIADLEALKQTAIFEERIPARATDYVEGVELTQGAESGAPDGSFRAHVRAVVRRKAYDSAFGVQLSDRQMSEVEYFLCGGGSRMDVYSKVIHAALTAPSGSLFRANRRTLRVPADLEAPGLSESEYDRFAVAYGLSRLDRTRVIDVKPLPPRRRTGGSYQDRLISKEMC